MKIAFIDHLSVGSGLVRYATRLANNMMLNNSDVSVDYYTHSNNYNTNTELYRDQLFKVHILKSTLPPGKFQRILSKLRRKMGFKASDKLALELSAIQGYDVVYFTSAHMSPFYVVKGKKFATFHDFNWKYSFGTPNFSKQDVEKLNIAMGKWLQNTMPIVSSDFMRNELTKFYGSSIKNIEVVYLPNLAQESKSGNDLLPKEITGPYLLYPANVYAHKNHFGLYQALLRLKTNGRLNNIKLVITGYGTDHFKYARLCNEGIVQADEHDYDVLGLGYVNHDQMDALIRNATLNISTSLYESGSGPALDAWVNEAPVIISNIESHLNQLSFFKIDCITFDPTDHKEIADKITFALNDLALIKEQSIHANQALKNYNWNAAAEKYLNIFKQYGN